MFFAIINFFLIFNSSAQTCIPSQVVPNEYIAKLKKPGVIPHNLIGEIDKFKTTSRFVKIKTSVPLSKISKAGLEYIEPNYQLHTFKLPNDPQFSELWSLMNTGQIVDAEGKPNADINITPLWEKGFTGSKKIKVAVIDTGIDCSHPDLKDNIYSNPKEIENNGIDDDGNGLVDDIHGWNFINNSPDASDDNDHGTHVAGTIGAKGNNQLGVVGVNWDVSLIPIKFLNDRGSGTTEHAVEAVNYAVKMGAQVINASWGGDPYSRALEEAIENARDNNVLFVVAAGNDTFDNDVEKQYPAAYTTENLISVAATDNRDLLANFSNYGRNSVHLSAPGVLITSTVPNNGYAAFSGTSMAAPHVAGIAALMWSIESKFSYKEVKARLMNSSDVQYDQKRKIISQGRVNAYNAVMGIYPPRDPDEKLWKDFPKQFETPHPYEDAKEIKVNFTIPNAKYVRLHFSHTDTEEFDKIFLETPTGTVVETLYGEKENYFSEPVQGNTLVLRFKPDLSLAKWGFLIDKIQYISE